MPDWLEPLAKYVIVPMAGWIFWLQKKVTSQGESISALEAKPDATGLSRDIAVLQSKTDGTQKL